MMALNDSDYKKLARILIDDIGDKQFYNGSILYSKDEADMKLAATLIIKREESDTSPRIVPVWCELYMGKDPDYSAHDFAWSDLKIYLQEYI